MAGATVSTRSWLRRCESALGTRTGPRSEPTRAGPGALIEGHAGKIAAQLEAEAQAMLALLETTAQGGAAGFQARLPSAKTSSGGRRQVAAAGRPRGKGKVNLSDEESRVTKAAAAGLAQCVNARTMVDSESMRLMVPRLTQAGNRKAWV